MNMMMMMMMMMMRFILYFTAQQSPNYAQWTVKDALVTSLSVRNFFYGLRLLLFLRGPSKKFILKDNFCRILQKRKSLVEQGPGHDMRVILKQAEVAWIICDCDLAQIFSSKIFEIRFSYQRIFFSIKRTTVCWSISLVPNMQPAG